MSNNSAEDDFYGSLAAAAGEDSDSDAKAIQEMDDLDDDLFGNLLKKHRRGSGSPKMNPKLPALEINDTPAEKGSRPRAGRRRASIIDDDDLLDGLLPSDNESPAPPKTNQTTAAPTTASSVTFGSYAPSVSSGVAKTARQATAEAQVNPSAAGEIAPSVSFGSYVPSVSSVAAKTPRQATIAESERHSVTNGTSDATPRRGQNRLHEETQRTPKQDSHISSFSSTLDAPVESRAKLNNDNDGLDRVPQRERRSSLKDASDLQAVGIQEQRHSGRDLDWLTDGGIGNGRGEAGRRRGRSGELPWLDTNAPQAVPPKANAAISHKEADVPRTDKGVRTDVGSSHADMLALRADRSSAQSEIGLSRSSMSLPFQQPLHDRPTIATADVRLNSSSDQLRQDVRQQTHHGGPSVSQEVKVLEENVIKFASSLEGKMEKIKDDCNHIQQLLLNTNESHEEQRKALSEASRLELERLQNAGLDLETRLTKIHLDWKKDLVNQEEEWSQKWSGSCRQLTSAQQEWKNQVEGTQARVRDDIAVFQRELQSFVGKLRPLQNQNEDRNERRQDGLVDELTKLNTKIDRLVSQLETDRQLLLESRRPSNSLSGLQRSQAESLTQQEQQARAREETMVHQIMEKIHDLQEKATDQLGERIKHLEKTQEQLSSSVNLLVSDVQNSFDSTSNRSGLASLKTMKVQEEQLLEWHSQLEEESQSLAIERIELAKQKNAVHQLTAEIEQRFREIEENEAAAKNVQEIGLQALNQSKQLDASWKDRMAALNDKLEVLQRKELDLLQRKQADKFPRQRNEEVTEVNSCKRCRDTLVTSQAKLDVPSYWTVELDPLLDHISDFHLTADDSSQFEQSATLLRGGDDGLVDSKVLMWSLLAVQDRKLLQEEQSYLESLSLSRTMSGF